jgi:hypothetical protein
MVSYEVTWRDVTYGTQNTITGWYSRTYTESTVDMVFLRELPTRFPLPAGVEVRGEIPVAHIQPMEPTDEIKRSVTYYEVVSTSPVKLGNSLICYMSQLHELPYHTDTRPTPTVDPGDIRYDIRVMMDAYITDGNITEDDGTTQASWVSMFERDDLRLTQVFLTKNVDVVFTVGEADSITSQLGVAFLGKYPITAFAVDKEGLTATTVNDKAVKEIRKIFKENPVGSMRGYSEERAEPHVLGSTTIWSKRVLIDYETFNA